MIPDLLRKLGLSPGEIKIYSALLNLGSSPLNKIHERTGIERRNIYDILNKLIERGLVTYITENKRKVFQISPPKNLIGYLENKEKDLESLKSDLSHHLPELNSKYQFKRTAISAEVYRGEEGIKAVWEDMLNFKDTYWIGSGRYIPKRFPGWFANWNRRRIEKKIWWHNLLRQEMRPEKISFEFEKARFLPKEFSKNPAVICIYGHKVINFTYGKDLFAFVVENQELAENYRSYHRYLWEKAAKA